MIVLWGVPGDGPLDAVRAALVSMGVPHRLIDQREAACTSVEMDIDTGGAVCGVVRSADGTVLSLDDVAALYLRPFASRDASGGVEVQRALCTDRRLLAWADTGALRVVNPPEAMAANNAKPFQLAQIRAFGFLVPATIVTTDPRAAQAFWDEHGSVIYKSVSGVRSIVSRLDATHRDRLCAVAHAPTQFQQHIAGDDVRVHVVGAEVFATEIRTAADDYRYAGRVGAGVHLAEISLPEAIATRCVTMVHEMGLLVGGIDLRRTPDGEWCCFEVNPSPAFTYYEEATGQPIAEAVARLLVA